MAITLGTLTLPDNFIWIDEFSWSSVQQARDYALSGALLIQEAQMLSGRPITLSGDSDRGNWMKRSALLELQSLAESAMDVAYPLTLQDGRNFSVRFARPAFEADPVHAYIVPDPNDDYIVTIHLFEAPVE